MFGGSKPIIASTIQHSRLRSAKINANFCQQCIGRLQQHAALIGGPNATSCPLCHKVFLGGEALMEHMKHTHKDPNASGVASKYLVYPVYF